MLASTASISLPPLRRGAGVLADGSDAQLADRIEEPRTELSALYDGLYGEGEVRSTSATWTWLRIVSC